MSLTMTKEEREAFLSDVHIGAISISEERRGPLTVPIWYAYDSGGDVRVMRDAILLFKIFGIESTQVNAENRRPVARDLACRPFYVAAFPAQDFNLPG